MPKNGSFEFKPGTEQPALQNWKLDEPCPLEAIVESSSSLPQEITAAEEVGYRKRS
jgi:hypothetical protein